MAAGLDVRAPWNHANASLWDIKTLATWLDDTVSSNTARRLLELAVTSIFSTQSEEPSLLYALAYFAAAGNETTVGTIDRLLATVGGGQEWRVKGGTQLIATELSNKLGDNIVKLKTKVESIAKSGDFYLLHTSTGTVQAKRVVIAMSPPLAARISYDPLLPAARDQLTQRMPMGAVAKAVAFYETPFWRNDGLNGMVASDVGVIRATFDNSPEDASYGALMGFIEADEIRHLEQSTDEDIQALVQEDLVRYFGSEANNVTGWIIQRWDNEEFSRGGPVAFGPSGVLTKYGSALTEPVGGVFFAGTEASPYWTGFMDGAIRAGENAARAILEDGCV
ncbi:MAG: hypothetical protein Q9181_007834 [Wetmoreana brouardii]